MKFILIHIAKDLSSFREEKKSASRGGQGDLVRRTRQGSSTLFSITRRFKVGQLSRETFTRFRTPQFSLSFALRPLVPHPHLLHSRLLRPSPLSRPANLCQSAACSFFVGLAPIQLFRSVCRGLFHLPQLCSLPPPLYFRQI